MTKPKEIEQRHNQPPPVSPYRAAMAAALGLIPQPTEAVSAINPTEEALRMFHARVEEELRAAHAAGVDLAVSDFEFDPETSSLTASVIQLQPGQAPPLGRQWTVYESSKPLVPHI